jgi:hypothetical protein
MLVDALVRIASALVEEDLCAAGELVKEAVSLDRHHTGAKNLLATIEGRRLSDLVEDCIARALRLEEEGDRKAAIELLRTALADHADSRLSDHLQRLLAAERPLVLTQVNGAWEAAQRERDPDRVRPIVEAAKRVAAAYPDDVEFKALVGRLETRLHKTGRLWHSWFGPMLDRPSLHELAAGAVRQKWRIVTAIGGLALVVGLTYVVPILHRVELLPAEASAGASQGTEVFSEPVAGAKPSYVITTGDQVRVLQLPSARTEKWVRVQVVSPGGPRAPGFVEASRLSAFSSDSPDKAFLILTVFGPPDSAGESEIEAHLQALERFLARFGTTDQAPLASMRLAQFSILLARAQKESSQPEEGWQAEITELRAPAAPPPPAPTNEQDPRLQRRSRSMRQAMQLKEKGRYDEALSILGGIIQEWPDYRPARVSEDQVRDAKEEEAKILERKE